MTTPRDSRGSAAPRSCWETARPRRSAPSRPARGRRRRGIVDVAEVWQDNAAAVVRATAADRGPFPPEETAAAWLAAQEARHWQQEGGEYVVGSRGFF